MIPTPDNSNVRVRFAPSPTGLPHLGNVRTALFNWLFARHSGGTFILRVEDTDVARTVPGAVEMILESLRWLGLDWDEGPHFQSKRLSMYREAADRLIAGGNAYLCFCSTDRLQKMREDQMQRKQPPGYDETCRCLSEAEIARLKATGVTPVVRFKIPQAGTTAFPDLIRGQVSFENATLDDFVLLKSDGYPTYHLANVVDDHDMKVSHVLRAEEWLSSTPRHVLLYAALGWQPPQFAHLPMILGPDRSKLSKRHGATAVLEYRDQGYLPEAMFNFLSLLGWSLDDKTEMLTKEEMVRSFSIERITKNPAIFNKEKLDWMNGVYMRKLTVDDFARQALPFLEKSLPSEVSRPLDVAYVQAILPLIQERAKTLAEVPELTSFFFVEEPAYDTGLLLKGLDTGFAKRSLTLTIEKLNKMSTWECASMESLLRPLAEELGLKTGVYFGLLRVAVTGRTASPPLFQTVEAMGKDRSLKRLTSALNRL